MDLGKHWWEFARFALEMRSGFHLKRWSAPPASTQSRRANVSGIIKKRALIALKGALIALNRASTQSRRANVSGIIKKEPSLRANVSGIEHVQILIAP